MLLVQQNFVFDKLKTKVINLHILNIFIKFSSNFVRGVVKCPRVLYDMFVRDKNWFDFKKVYIYLFQERESIIYINLYYLLLKHW